MKLSVLKKSILAMALGGMVLALSSCAGGGSQKIISSADGVAFGPDGKPVAYKGGVPVATRSNQFTPEGGGSSSGGGGGGH